MNLKEILSFQPNKKIQKIVRGLKLGWISEKRFAWTLEKTIRFRSWALSKDEEDPIRIFGATEFMGLPFFVFRSSFRPRVDSEILCVELINVLKSLGFSPKTVFEPFCGTGCQVISVSKRLGARGVGFDINRSSVINSLLNADINAADVHFGLIKFEEACFKCDLAIFNPPYLKTKDIHTGDPSISLDGGESGDFYLKTLIKKIQNGEIVFKVAMLEVGYSAHIDLIKQQLEKYFIILETEVSFGLILICRFLKTSSFAAGKEKKKPL